MEEILTATVAIEMALAYYAWARASLSSKK